MTGSHETRRLGLFLAVAFGLAWTTAVALWLTGGLANQPSLLPAVPLSLGLVAGPYRFASAVANVVTRLATGEGFAGRCVFRGSGPGGGSTRSPG